MRIYVVYDQDGNIISAGIPDRPAPEAHDQLAPRFGAEAQEGQHVAELEVSEEHVKLGLTDLTERLQVDVRAKQPELVAKEQ